MRSLWLALLITSTLFGCGKKPEAKSPTASAAAAAAVDTYALFPAGAVGLGTLDVNALLHAGRTGETLGRFLTDYSPIGPESGLSLEGNVDRLTCAAYRLETGDVLCVAEGRFDAAKLDQAVNELEARAKADADGAGKAPAVVRTPYAGRTLVTASNVGFSVLDAAHLLVGSEPAMRRALDRVRAGAKPEREIGKILEDRVASTKAHLAVSVSLEGVHGLRQISVGPIHVHVLEGLKEVYGTGQFKKKLVDAGTPNEKQAAADVTLVTHLVYADEGRANAELDDVAHLVKYNRLGATLGYTPPLADQAVVVKGNEAIVTLGYQDPTLAQFFAGLPAKLDWPPPSRSAGAPVPGADP